MIPKLILYYGSLTVCGGGLVFIGFSGTGVSTVNASVMIAGLGILSTGSYPYVTVSNPSESLPADRIVWIVTALAFITIINAVGNIFQLRFERIHT
jgi:uncharacterized membrane protein